MKTIQALIGFVTPQSSQEKGLSLSEEVWNGKKIFDGSGKAVMSSRVTRGGGRLRRELGNDPCPRMSGKREKL